MIQFSIEREWEFRKLLKTNKEVLYSMRKKQVINFLRRRGWYEKLSSEISIVDIPPLLDDDTRSEYINNYLLKKPETVEAFKKLKHMVRVEVDKEGYLEYVYKPRPIIGEPEEFFRRFKEWCEEIHRVEYNSEGTIIESIIKLLASTREGLNLPSITKYGDYDILGGSSSPIAIELIPAIEIEKIRKLDMFCKKESLVEVKSELYSVKVCAASCLYANYTASLKRCYRALSKSKKVVNFLLEPNYLGMYEDKNDLLRELSILKKCCLKLIYKDNGFGLAVNGYKGNLKMVELLPGDEYTFQIRW